MRNEIKEALATIVGEQTAAGLLFLTENNGIHTEYVREALGKDVLEATRASGLVLQSGDKLYLDIKKLVDSANGIALWAVAVSEITPVKLPKKTASIRDLFRDA